MLLRVSRKRESYLTVNLTSTTCTHMLVNTLTHTHTYTLQTHAHPRFFNRISRTAHISDSPPSSTSSSSFLFLLLSLSSVVSGPVPARGARVRRCGRAADAQDGLALGRGSGQAPRRHCGAHHHRLQDRPPRCVYVCLFVCVRACGGSYSQLLTYTLSHILWC